MFEKIIISALYVLSFNELIPCSDICIYAFLGSNINILQIAAAMVSRLFFSNKRVTDPSI